MAFKMNRPVIKGTANHKASIAKAKSESIIAQTRTQADTGLITAADAVGQSFSPKEIEYGTSMDAFKVPKKNDKKKAGKKKKKNKKEKTRKERIREEYDREHPSGTLFPNDDGGYQYYDADGKLVSKKVYDKDGNEVKKQKTNKTTKAEADRIAEQKRLATLKAQEARFKENKLDITSEVDESERLLQSIEEKKGEDIKTKPRPKEIVRANILTEEDIAIMNEKAKKAAEFDPEDERVYTKEDRERLKFDERTGEMRLPEEIAADKTNYNTSSVVEEKKTTTTTPTEKPKPSDFRTKKNAFGGTLTAQQQYKDALKEYYSKSPMEMRDNRIYRNAIKGGVVQQNMIKSGYKPE